MKQRSVIAILLLNVVTLGIYGIYWMVKTKGEMVEQGAEIPTAWLIIVPIIGLWWLWKWSEGVEKVTSKNVTTPIAFVLMWFLRPIADMIIQSSFNKVTGTVATPAAPQATAQM